MINKAHFHQIILKDLLRSVEFYFFLLVLAFFIYLSQKNYLIFHSYIEGFSILISASVFFLSWNIRRYLNHPILLYISIGFLFVSVLDSLHLFSYYGMNIYDTGNSRNPPTQFWIAARYLQAITFLLAPYLPNQKTKSLLVFNILFVATIITVYSVFNNIFPDCFVDGVGLTAFKIYSEFAIIFILLLSFYGYSHKSKLGLSTQCNSYLMLAIFVSILTELFFTTYKDVYDIFNMSGHILKTFSVYFIYKGVIQSVLSEPLDIIFQDLKKQQDILDKANNELQLEVSDYLHNLFFYRTALEESSIVIITNAQGVIEYVSESFVKISQFSRDEIIGKTSRIVNSGFHSADFFKSMWTTILNGEIWRGEIKNKSKDSHFYWVSNIIVPYKNQKGEIEKFVSIQQDISELKLQREVEIQTKKMAAIGELSSKILHDAMNPVSIISGLAFVLKGAAEKNDLEKVNSALDKIKYSVKRIQDMFLDLRQNLVQSKSNVESAPIVPTSIYNCVENAIQFFQEDARFTDVSIQMQNQVDQQLLITMSSHQLIQVFLNLFGNSYDAIKKLPERWILITSEVENQKLTIRVTDSGGGIPKPIADKMFDSLFTTKINSGGTGLGLGICKDIINEYGGTISINMNSPHTQFVISLSLHQ